MDQVKLLKHDNVVAPTAAGLADLGIMVTTADVDVALKQSFKKIFG